MSRFAKEKQNESRMTDKIKTLAYRSLIIAGILSCLFIFASWYSVSENGNDLLYTWVFDLLVMFGIGFLGGLFYVIFGLAGVVLRLKVPDRSRWKNTAVCCGIFFPCIILGCHAGLGIRNGGFRAIAARSGPLIEAVRKYQAANGLPPAKLDDLVPKYLSSVPRTGVGAYPQYIYVTNGISTRYEGNPWILIVPISSDTKAAYDLLIYFPNQQYPTNKYGDMGRFGKWYWITVDKSRAKTDGYAFDSAAAD